MLFGFIIGKLKRFFIYFSVLNFLFFKYKFIDNNKKINIMAKRNLVAFAAAMVMVMFSSCTKESSFLGMEYEVSTKTPTTTSKVSTKFENSEIISAKFDTTANKLFTVEQVVEVEKNTYKDNELSSGESLKKALDLNVIFSAEPVKVDVAEEALLSEVSLLATNSSEVAANTVAKDSVINYSQSYSFGFNAGENVKAAADWQAFVVENTTISACVVKSVSFAKAEVARVYNLSETVKAADVNLFFNVEVSDKEHNDNYVVRVPLQRVYTNNTLPTPPAEEVKSEVKVENTSYEAEFKTAALALNTVRQNVSGELVTYLVKKSGNEKVSENNFRRSLNLEALFTAPARTMVNSEAALKNVKVLSSSHDGDKTNVNTDGRFATTSRSQNFNFKFNENEKVAAATEYEYLAYGDTMFVYSSVQNISYAKCEVKENSAKSSDELKVVDVVLYFNVEVAKNDPEAKTKSASEISTYTVAVPYERAMKVEVEQPTEPEQPAKPIDRILPENWGSIIGAGISAVPADQVNGEYAQKCLTIRTDKGAVAVTFSMENEAPEVSSILSGYFVKGNFGAEYNSGYFTTNANRGTYAVGKWAPAVAKDLSDRIAYYKDNTCVRNVRNTSLVIWNWRSGNYSTVVDGYGFSVDSNSALTITYNGKVVMQLR